MSAKKIYRLAIPEFIDLSWASRPFHNEMVSIIKERYDPKSINYRRLYLLDFITMCEAEAFQLRTILHRFHEEGRIVLSSNDLKRLCQERFDNYEMYKLTWKVFAKHHGKTAILKPMFEGDGIGKVKAAFEKRNAVSHPKELDDIRITVTQFNSFKEARTWHHQMMLQVLEGSVLRTEDSSQ